MFERAVKREPYALEYVPDEYKTHEICERAVGKSTCQLGFVPDWFGKPKMSYIEDVGLFLFDTFDEQHNSYKNCSALKKRIDRVLLPDT